MTRRIVYVAGPYTHADPLIRVERFTKLTQVAADLVKQGCIVYSPITHTHPLDLCFVRDGVELSSDFWVDFDETFMAVCTEMLVVKLPGWDKSSGVRREMAYFQRHGLPVNFLEDQ